MTQVDPGINLKNPQKQEAVPKWYQAPSSRYFVLLAASLELTAIMSKRLTTRPAVRLKRPQPPLFVGRAKAPNLVNMAPGEVRSTIPLATQPWWHYKRRGYTMFGASGGSGVGREERREIRGIRVGHRCGPNTTWHVYPTPRMGMREHSC